MVPTVPSVVTIIVLRMKEANGKIVNISTKFDQRGWVGIHCTGTMNTWPAVLSEVDKIQSSGTKKVKPTKIRIAC